MDTLSPDHDPSASSQSLLTASQLVRRFAVSRNWVYQAVADDVLPHVRLGEEGPIRFVATEIDAWLDPAAGGAGHPAGAGFAGAGEADGGRLDHRTEARRRLERV